MGDLSALYDVPSAVFLESCKKEELLEIAEHYEIELEEGILKDELKVFVLLTLFERGMFQKVPGVEPALSKREPGAAALVEQAERLTFAQERELLQLQLEVERTKLRVLDRNERRPAASGSVAEREGRDLTASLRLVPKFNERDPEICFTLFERVADARGWPDVDRVCRGNSFIGYCVYDR